MDGKTKNMAASVHQRLLNKSKESSRPFNELLQHFVIERFIYRLSKSPHSKRFILKGALMFSAWTGSMSRPTMDIDFQGFINKAKLGDAPASFENVVTVIKMFLQPVVAANIDWKNFRFFWAAPGPWRK